HPDAPVSRREMDLASSIQTITERVVLQMAREVHARTGSRNLCLAGGVALNCVANGRLHREGPFDEIWIQPAAGDAGGALGCALATWHRGNGRVARAGDSMQGSLLGPEPDDEEIEAVLRRLGAVSERVNEDELVARVE